MGSAHAGPIRVGFWVHDTATLKVISGSLLFLPIVSQSLRFAMIMHSSFLPASR